jgi:O-antigen ligase
MTSPDAPGGALRHRSRPPGVLHFSEAEILGFVLLHAPLAAVLTAVPFVSTLHALAALAAGVAAVARDREPSRTIAAIAYITGAELLWRGTRALVFWEVAKYAAIALALLALLRWGAQLRRLEPTGLVYVLLMAPSLLALPYFDREEVAFNLSGPVCLGLCVWVFSGVRLEPRVIRFALSAMLAPIVGLGFLAAVSTVQVQDFSEVVIGGKATTAGIGPNQVSAMLGLGALLAMLLVPMLRRRPMRLAFAGIALWLLAQAMVSLSRGGFWAGLIAMTFAYLMLLQDRRQRRVALATAIILVPAFQFLVFPAIDAYTGGLVGARIVDDRLTGRDKIVIADVEMFQENPILGVGPGQSKYGHASNFRVASAHVEYSRLLAEHGIFGVLAMVLLVIMGLSQLRRCRHPLQRAMVLSFGLWAAMTMGHSAMRSVAPATVFALAGVHWVLPGDPQLTTRRRRRWHAVPLARAPTGHSLT